MNRRIAAAVALAVALLLALIVTRREAAPPVAPLAVTPAPSAPAAGTTSRQLRQPSLAYPAPPVQLIRPPALRPAPAEKMPGALEGVVVDAESDAGIAGAVLSFSHDDGAHETATAPGGAFRFAPREAGSYRLVSLEANGYLPFEGDFGRSPVSFTSVAGRDVTGVVLRLVRERGVGRPQRPRETPQKGAGALRGRVVDARTGAPVAVFAIALWKRDGIRYSEMVAPASFIDPSGAYEIAGLAPGTYEATALAAGYAPAEYAVAEVADASVPQDFALRSGARLSGTVRDAVTGAPVAAASISLEGRRGNAPNLPAAPLSPETSTGADGRFLLEHVPPDAISLSVEKDGYLTRLVSLGGLPAEGDAASLEVRLTPPPQGADAHFELTGIGAVLRASGDALVLHQVIPNAGASDAGLAPGDQILAIDGVSVAKLGYEGSIGAIRGPEGTAVTLHIRRGGNEMNVIVTRKLVRG